MKPTIIILTLNAENTINCILDKIDTQCYNILIIDSSTTDQTRLICQNYNCKVHVINKYKFNHGTTREMARNLVDSQIVIFLTQDAIPFNKETLDKLIEPIISGKAHVSYARQIPKDNSDIFEYFPREYNYGKKSQTRSLNDVDENGVYTFFCSNSCAAWSNTALDEIGGFKPTLTNEDYIACAELLIKGHKVAYVSEAKVIHSHKYSLSNEFRRMFDTGYVRAQNPWIQDAVGNAENRGRKYFLALINNLLKENPLLIPYAFLQTIMKYLGYKIGYNARNLPIWLKKAFSQQNYYWESKYYS